MYVALRKSRLEIGLDPKVNAVKEVSLDQALRLMMMEDRGRSIGE